MDDREKLVEIARYVLEAEDSRGLVNANPIKRMLKSHGILKNKP